MDDQWNGGRVDDAPSPGGGTRRTGERPPSTDTVRVGIVGGGLIAQVAHLPSLRALAGRFAIAGLADPSHRVRAALGARYGIRSLHADHRSLIAAGGLDAILVCAPNGRHADVALDALDAGLHVFVEKPLCIALDDADRIAARRDAVRRVVQVGYMKRFEPAYEALVADAAAGIRHVASATVDPGLARAFAPAGLVTATDVPRAEAGRLRRETAAQVGAAVGADDPASVAAFSDVFLGALIHDVNAVHGVLERSDAAPVAAVDAVAAPGLAAATAALPGGGRWTMAWLHEPGAGGFSEQLAFYGTDGVRRLEFPAPYVRPSVASYERLGAAGPQRWSAHTLRGHRDAYVAELEHFHDCIASGAACRTPVEQARTDIALLTDLYACHLREAAPA